MNVSRLFRILGPGMLYAGAAIGVSHLIQSTRAGAMVMHGSRKELSDNGNVFAGHMINHPHLLPASTLPGHK